MMFSSEDLVIILHKLLNVAIHIFINILPSIHSFIQWVPFLTVNS